MIESETVEIVDLLSFNDVNMLQIDNNGPTMSDKSENVSKFKLKNFIIKDTEVMVHISRPAFCSVWCDQRLGKSST